MLKPADFVLDPFDVLLRLFVLVDLPLALSVLRQLLVKLDFADEGIKFLAEVVFELRAVGVELDSRLLQDAVLFVALLVKNDVVVEFVAVDLDQRAEFVVE